MTGNMEVERMGLASELSGDFMKLIATLGVVIGFVVLFLIWTSLGVWAIIVLLVVAAGGFFLWKRSHP